MVQGIQPYVKIYADVAENGKPTEFETFFEPMDKYFRISVISPDKGKFATIFDDITKSKMAEKRRQELLEKEQQLTEELTVSNEELQSTTKELQVTNEELHQKEDTLIHINIELQKSEQRLRRLYDSDLFGVIYWNMDNKIEDANDKFLEMVGYTRDDLKSGLINWSEMTPPEYRYLDERSVVELKATGVNKEPFEKEYIRKDGTRIPIIIAGAMLDELKFNGVAFVLDITERKKAEESLIQSQKLLQDIINGFPSPIFVKDLEGRFLTVNNKLEELLGVKTEELKGKTDYDIITKELAEDYRINDQKVLEEGKAKLFEEEADLIDGHHTFINHKFPIYDINGKTYGIGSVSTDITERKLLEEKVQKNTEELLKSNIELKRSNEELERFAYVSSHDLQEPLRMVTLYSQLLERRYKDNLDEDADDFIEYIVDNAKRMKYLIDDLLEYSRVSSQAKEFQNINLEKVLEYILRKFIHTNR